MQNFANFNSFVPPKSSPIPNNQFSNFNQNFSTNPPSNLSNLQLDTNLEAAQTIPKPKLKANLNNNERGYYSSLLSQADPINANSVQGKEAVAFFKRSGLPVDVLKKIWLLASSNNTSLEREEFYVALKLIALAQNNIEVSGDSIMRNITTPLPKFNAIIHEKKEEKIEDNSVNINPSNEMNMNPIQPSFNSETNIQHIGVNNTQQYNNPNMMGITGSIPSSNSRGLSDLDSKISLEKMHKYEVCFKNNDPQHLGYIAGNEAKEIFMKSGLPTQQLFQIWKLVDTKKEGNLSKGEFIVALHLIMLSRSGFILPQELPKPLLDIILAFQTPQETNIKTNLHRNSMDLMNVNEIVKDDKCINIDIYIKNSYYFR